MITLTGEPRSTQNCYKYACRGGFLRGYMKAECADLKEDYQWQAKAQWKRGVMHGELEIHIRIYFGTKRKADWDNFHKLSMDALTGIVWEDDSQIRRATVELFYDKLHPRIELLIKDI